LIKQNKKKYAPNIYANVKVSRQTEIK